MNPAHPRADRPAARPPFLQLWVLATCSAAAVHLAEAAVAAGAGNALLAALPPAQRALYLACVFLAFPALALVAAALAWAPPGMPALSRVLALALPPGFLAFEAIRKSDDLGGRAPWTLAAAAVALVVLGIVTGAMMRDAISPLQRRKLAIGVVAASWALLGLALAGASMARRDLEPRVAMAGTPGGTGATGVTGATDGLGAPPYEARVPKAELPVAKNVVVILIDTLRADHTSLHGYERRTTPRIDAFAKGGTTFERCVTPKGQTSPAIASLFTGMLPRFHGVMLTRTYLADDYVTLAELTAQAGIENVGVSSNVSISEFFNFDQGFPPKQFLTVKAPDPKIGHDVVAVTQAALRQIEEASAGGKRFFSYVHILDPHSPYTPPLPYQEPYRKDRLYGALADRPSRKGEHENDYMEAVRDSVWLSEELANLDGYVARYDGEILHTDEVVGRFLDELERKGLLEDTAVVITADHGESLTDHDCYFNHGRFAYEEHLHVPLVIRGPGVAAGQRRTELVTLTGLMPTILELLGLEPPPGIQEPSFQGLLAASTPTQPERATLVMGGYVRRQRMYGIRTERWKFIQNPRGVTPDEMFEPSRLLRPNKRFACDLARLRNYDLERELYDLDNDPRELENLAWREPEETARLAALTKQWLAVKDPEPVAYRPVPANNYTSEMRDELIKNGYLAAGPATDVPPDPSQFLRKEDSDDDEVEDEPTH